MKQSLWNRLLSFMLAAAMLFSLISTPAAAWAAEEDGSTAGNPCGDNATWTLENGVLTISGTGSTTLYEDESTTPWTDVRDSITKLVIESGITGIGDSLVRGCTNLVDVEIADTVTSLGAHVFSGCTSLSQIALPEGITRIGYSAFASTGLTAVTLPSTVTQVEWNVFDGCTALNRVVFTGDAPTFTPDTFVNVTTTVSYPENNATWTSDVLQQYGGNITWEGYTLGVGGGEEDTCVEGEVCHGDSTLGVHICAYNFPDAIMENCVNTGFDTDGDGYLSADEAEAVTNIEWTEYGIQSLEGIHHFPKLQQLQCDGNGLTSLDLSGNTELIYVDCSCNRLTELDVSSLTKLEALYCYENDLTALELSANAALTMLNCSNNELLWLNLDNQSEMQVLNYEGQHRYCVFEYTQQDDAVWVDMAQFVGQENIGRIAPDMEGATYDSATGIMTFSELPGDFPYNYELQCPAKPDEQMWVVIHYGSGGESSNQETDPFENACSDSTEESLHICGDNFPDEAFRVFVQNNYDQDGDGYLSRTEAGAVTEIHCEGMGIGSVEGIRHFSQLQALFCEENAITELDATANANLWWVNCNNNQITNLNVSGLTKLEILYCGYNQLTQLDVSSNTALVDLSCPGNQLTALDVSNNPGLLALGFEENSISFVDISMLTNLETLYCGDNRLTELDLSNKPNLQVVYCFRNELSALDVSASTELRELHFDGNNLTSIDLSNNTKLEYLNCSENQISQLDVNHLTNLISLRCYRNRISQLDISGLTKLEVLVCDHNLLKTLDMSNNTALVELRAGYNLLTELDISSSAELQQLDVDTNMIETLDLSNNTALWYLNLRNNELSQVDVTMLSELTEVLFCMNDLTTLDVSRNTKLQQLSFPENEIASIDLSNNPEITWLVLYDNPITAIDLSAQTKLEWLDVGNTKLTSLDLSSNTAMTGMNCGGCKLRTLDLSNQANLYNCNVSEQQINTVFSYTETVDGCTVDMAQFVGADNISRIESVGDASYDSATGIATFSYIPDAIIYWYIVNNPVDPAQTMTVCLWYGCDHQWEIDGCDRTCSSCGDHGEEHTFGIWTVVELPTMTTEGTLEKVCALCGATETDIISAGTSGILAGGGDTYYESHLEDVNAAAAVVLTDAEKTEVENGSLAVLTLNTKEINDTVSKLETILVQNTLEDREQIGMYLDMQLYKQVGLGAVEQITDTGDTPVAISIMVPEWLRNAGYTYQIVRVCGEEAAELTPVYNADTGELTFETDVFGTFVLTYIMPEEVSGELTGDISWYLSSEGWLYIQGSGAMPDYACAGDAPWQAYADRITYVQVQDGITHIGLYAFSGFPYLREVYIAETVTSVGEGAFMDCQRLFWVSLAEVTEIGASAFRNCVALTEINIPASVQSIGNWAFSGCTALSYIAFNGDAPAIGENAFAGVTATVSRPDGNESWTEDVMQQYGGTLTWQVGQTSDYMDIYADTVTWVEHFEDNYGVYRFTPEYSHTYYFQSLSDDIPYGILVDSNDNVLAESDSENACFDFSCWLEAGQTYYLGVRTDGWGGGFDMIIRTQHSYQEEVVTEATCTVAGIIRFTCTECGESYEGEYFADHTYGEDNICTLCGDEQKVLVAGTEVTVDVAEDEIAVFKFTPTVTENYYFCSVAGGDTYGIIYNSNMEELVSNDDDGSQNFGITITVEAGTTIYLGARLLGGEAGTITVLMQIVHSYISETVTEATCTVEGLIRYTCEYCGDSYEESYLADHTYGEDNLCTVCGDENGESGTCGDNLSWSYLDGVLTVSGTGAMYDYEENGAPWQQYMTEMTQLMIADGVTYIGSYAFYNYTMWDNINVPASVTSLGSYAFQAQADMAPTGVNFNGDAPSLAAYAFGTNNGYVYYPYSNTTWNEAVKEACGESIILNPYDDQGLYIDMGGAGHDLIWILDSEYTLKLVGSGKMEAYYMADMPWVTYWDSIQRIELPEGLTNIRYLSFCGLTKVTSITIPSTVVEVGMHAIDSCGALESIYFTGDAPVMAEVAFNQITATVYYPAGNETWTEEVMQQYGGTLTWEAYEVGDSEEPGEPEEPEISWNDDLTWSYADGVLTISGTGAMNDYGSEDTSVVPWYAYVEQIHTVIIEEGVTNVGAYAFYGCTALTTVNLPASVTAFGQGAFFSSGLTSFVIPATVTTVGSHIFAGCNNLTTVEIMGDLNAITDSMFFSSGLTTLTIHGSIDRIGPNAFFCTELTAIQIPEGVTAIDWAAFNGCSLLESVTLPSTLTSIGDSAFFHCTALREINLPDSLKTIGIAAFAHCEALTELVIPARVRTIEDNAFWCCYGIPEVTFLGVAPAIGQDAFYGLNATVYYPAQKSGWTTDVLQQYGGTLTWRGIIGQGSCGDDLSWILYGDGELVISGTGPMEDYSDEIFVPWYKYRDSVRTVLLEDGVNHIGSYAFYDCALTSVTIPQSVTEIGSYAFSMSSLQWVEIPNSVTSIGSYAFGWCDNLYAVTLPESITGISYGLFYSCNRLSNIAIPVSVTSIGSSAFYDSGLTSVEIPVGVATIGSQAFANCGSLTGIWVQTGNEAYSSDASGVLFDLEQTTLIQAPGGLTGTYSIPNTVTTVGAYAFYRCTGLSQVEIPTSVTVISSCGFCGCTGLTEVTLPEGLTTLGSDAFRGCTGLTSISVPSTVTGIGTAALRCENLTGIWVAEGNATYSSDDQGVLYNKDKTVLIQVPCGLSGSYTIAQTVTAIGRYAFADCDRLTAVVIPGGVTEIQAGAFYGCTALEEITLSEGVETIGDYAFYNCDSLVSVNIPASVTSISWDVFNFCDSLTGIWVADDNANYSSDEHGVLFDKDKLNLMKAPGGLSGTYTVPDTVIGISSYAFYTCRKLTGVEIPESVTAIWDYAFANSGLTDIVIPDSVKSIGHYLFNGCEDLQSVTLSKNLQTITTLMFGDCISLREIVIPASVTSIYQKAFGGCTSLTSIRFQGNAPTIVEDGAFLGVTATVQYPVGDTTWTEEIMADYCGTLTWVAYGYDLSGASVSLGDSLDMHFFVPAAYVGEGCYAKITRTYADGREDHVITVGYEDWDMLNSQLLYVTYGNLAAKEMNDVLTVVICDANGNALSNPWTDSIHDYAMRMLAKDEVITDSELRTVYVDMLNYGAAAQTQFGYDTEHLANADLTDEQQSYATASYETESNLVSGTGRAGTALTLKNRITLDLMFSNVYLGTDVSDLQAVISYVDHCGRYVEILVEGEDFKSYGSRYTYVSVPGLAIADYGQVVECAIYDADWSLVVSAKDSIEGYAHRMAGKLPTIVDAIMKFGVSAYNYFH